MRNTVLAGVAAAAVLSLLTAAPAFAETQTETTETSHSVPANIAIEIPYDFDVWWDASLFVPTGEVVFPLEAMEYDGMFVHDTFAMSAVAPEGCERVVESFTFGYTLAEYPPALEGSAVVVGGIGSGEPLVFAPLENGRVSHMGDGLAKVDPERVYVDLTMDENPQPQSGALTMEYPEPVDPDVARGYIGFGLPDSITWVVDNASFIVTDTCTSEVEITVTDPPSSTAEAAKPTLAETGMDAGLAVPTAALLFGAGIAALLVPRRRTRHI